jgi:hypothetical protein
VYVERLEGDRGLVKLRFGWLKIPLLHFFVSLHMTLDQHYVLAGSLGLSRGFLLLVRDDGKCLDPTMQEYNVPSNMESWIS